MAQVLIVAGDGHARLARVHFDEEVSAVEETPVEEHELSWRLIGLAIMAVVSAAGWVVILAAAKHFLR
jgi:hypothetical protein